MVSLINSILTYLLLIVIIVLVAGVAVFIGISLRKRKDQKTQLEEAQKEEIKA